MRLLALLIAASALIACGKIAQSAECDRYENCAIALDPGVTRVVNGQFGRQGTCWQSTQITADTCTTVCVRELEALRNDGGIDLPECQ